MGTAPRPTPGLRPLRLVHVTSSLGQGGADRQILALSAGLAARGHDVSIISLTRPGPMAEAASGSRVRIESLDLERGRIDPSAVLRLTARLQVLRADVVQAWMYHGNVLASLAGLLRRPWTPVIWNIRHSLYNLEHERWLTRQVIRLHRPLAGTARRIVYNAGISARQHEAFGLPARKSDVIPNGIDTERFRPQADGIPAVSRQSDEVFIGCIARHHPQKDHPTLFAAVREASRAVSALRLVLAGPRTDPGNPVLMAELDAAGIRDRTTLLGPVSEVEALYPALDMAVLASAFGEGFPNTLGEAMATGVPCVATDVGDGAVIIGDTGIVVPPRDPDALARALVGLARRSAEERATLGARARLRIRERFSLEQMIQRYETLYRHTLAQQGTAPAPGITGRVAGRGPAIRLEEAP